MGGVVAQALVPFYRPALNSNYFLSNSFSLVLWTRLQASIHKLHVHCSSKAQLSQSGPIAQIDFTPLCERPAAHNSTVGELLAWRRWAQDTAMAVGKKYHEADGGPDAEDLLRELEWMLEDAVSHGTLNTKQPKTSICILEDAKSHEPPCTEQPETMKWMLDDATSHGPLSKTMKWRDIKTLEARHNHSIVCLRASVEELSLLWTQRVQHRRPFQYVVGCAHWRDYVLCVKEGVLIPRPETEQMIDLAQEAIKAHPSLSKGLWADLGTGSGALAIGLGGVLDPQGAVVAVDISNEAVSISSLNIQRYGLQNKVKVLQGSWFSVLGDEKGKLAGVLSNPPYIPSHCIPSLQAEVANYEPRNALDGGQQGTDDLITICHGAAWALQSDGCLILETNGGGQAEVMAEFLQSMLEAPFYDIQLVKDYAGIVRFVKASHA